MNGIQLLEKVDVCQCFAFAGRFQELRWADTGEVVERVVPDEVKALIEGVCEKAGVMPLFARDWWSDRDECFITGFVFKSEDDRNTWMGEFMRVSEDNHLIVRNCLVTGEIDLAGYVNAKVEEQDEERRKVRDAFFAEHKDAGDLVAVFSAEGVESDGGGVKFNDECQKFLEHLAKDVEESGCKPVTYALGARRLNMGVWVGYLFNTVGERDKFLAAFTGHKERPGGFLPSGYGKYADEIVMALWKFKEAREAQELQAVGAATTADGDSHACESQEG